MLNASDIDIIEYMIREALPAECKRVGKKNVRDMVERSGHVEIVPLSGSRTDWTICLSIIAASLGILSNGLSIVRNMKSEKSTKADIESTVSINISKEIRDELGPERINKLIDTLMKSSH